MPHQPGILLSALLSVTALAMFALVWGGLWMIVKRGQRQKGALMIVCALVLLGNILIWAV